MLNDTDRRDVPMQSQPSNAVACLYRWRAFFKTESFRRIFFFFWIYDDFYDFTVVKWTNCVWKPHFYDNNFMSPCSFTIVQFSNLVWSDAMRYDAQNDSAPYCCLLKLLFFVVALLFLMMNYNWIDTFVGLSTLVATLYVMRHLNWWLQAGVSHKKTNAIGWNFLQGWWRYSLKHFLNISNWLDFLKIFSIFFRTLKKKHCCGIVKRTKRRHVKIITMKL